MSLLENIQGHWVRQWIKAPGFKDETTRVHWMQVGSVYADVRIPADRPDLTGYQTLSELPAAALLEYTVSEGFAGHVTLQDTHCTWHREVNWHGTPETVDVGDISFNADGRMIEQGVLAEYTELWEQRASEEVGHAYRARGEGYVALLVLRGAEFVLGVGKPEKPSTSAFVDALKLHDAKAGGEEVFGGIHAIGRLDGNMGIAELATQPFSEGQPVVTLDDETLIWHRIGFDGARQDVVLQIEKTVVAAGPA